MKKRILSILLAVALLLSVGVVPARAADSCVSVKADAATTAEVVAGDLLEIPLGDIFRDSDGHSLTYTLVNAAQFGTQTKVGGSTLYVSEKDPGTYEPKIKATCSGGKSVTATLTVTVKPAPPRPGRPVQLRRVPRQGGHGLCDHLQRRRAHQGA